MAHIVNGQIVGKTGPTKKRHRFVRDAYLNKTVTFVGRDPERRKPSDIVYYKGKAVEKTDKGYICRMVDQHVGISKEPFMIELTERQITLF